MSGPGWSQSLRSESGTTPRNRIRMFGSTGGDSPSQAILDASMMDGPRGRATSVGSATKAPLSIAKSRPTAPPIPPSTSGKPTKTPARPSVKPPQSSLNTADSDDLSPRAGSVMSADNGSVQDDDDSTRGGQSVQVVVRVRPANAAELDTSNQSTCVEVLGTRSLRLMRPGHMPSTYKFDRILGTTATQMEAFEVAGEPIVDNCLSGYNSSIFAYGQTGSGKTYTMMGSLGSGTELCVNDQTGLAPRVFEYLYNQIAKEEEADENVRITCRCSFLEIYNEVVSDLLRPQGTGLQIEPDGHGGYTAKGATEEAAVNASEVLTLMRRGAEQRHTAATRLNATSSRSHSVFTCLIERSCKSAENGVTKVIFSRLNLVDLAGSERISSGAMGGSQASGQQFVETTCINQSLLTLGRIIEKLAKAQQKDVKVGHLEHRESRLTFLLKDSLGGNAKTTIIATVSASSVCAAETRSTLEFVRQAKHVRNRAVVNLDCRGDVGSLQKEIQRLTADLEHLRAGFTDPAIQECAELRRVLQEKQVEMDKLQRHVDEVTLEARHVKRERDRLEERLMGVQTNAGRHEDSAGRLMQKCDLMEAAIEAAKSAAAQVAAAEQQRVAVLQQEVDAQYAAASAAVAERDALAQRLAALAHELEAEQQSRAAVTRSAEATTAQLASTAAQLEAVSAQLSDSMQARAAADAQNHGLRGEVEVLQRERAAAVEAASLSAGSLTECRAQLQLLQQAHCETSQAKGGLQAQVGTLAEQAAQVKAQLDAERAVRAERDAALAATEAALAAARHELTATSANLGAQMTAEVGKSQQVSEALSALQHQYATAEARLAGKEATCRQLTADLEAAVAEAATLQQQLSVAQHRGDESSSHVSVLQEQLSAAQQAVEEGNSTAATLQEQLAATQQQLVEADATASQLQQQLELATASAADHAAELQQQLTVAESTAAEQTSRIEVLEQQLSAVQRAVQEGEEAAEVLRSELESVRESLAAEGCVVEGLRREAESERAETTAVADALRLQLDTLQGSSGAQVQALCAQLEAEQHAHVLTRAQLQELGKVWDAELEGRSAAEATAADLRVHLASVQEELSATQEQVAALEAQSASSALDHEAELACKVAAAEQLTAELAASSGRVDELQQAQAASQVMIEEQAGAIAQLKQDIESARSTHASSVAALEALVSDKTATADDLRRVKAELLVCIEGLQAEQDKAQGELAAAAQQAEGLNARLERYEAERVETAKQLADGKVALEKLRVALAEEEKAHCKSKASLEAVRSKLDASLRDAAEASAASGKQEKDARDLRKEIFRLEEAMVGKEFELKSQVADLKGSLEAARKEQTVLQARLDERCAELAASKQRLLVEQQLLASATSRLAEREQELDQKSQAGEEAATLAEQRLRQEQEASEQQRQEMAVVRTRLHDLESQLKGYLLANTRQTKAFTEIRRLIEWATTPPSSARSSVTPSEAPTPAANGGNRGPLTAVQRSRSLVAAAAEKLAGASASSPVASPGAKPRSRYADPGSPMDSPNGAVVGVASPKTVVGGGQWSSPEEDARPRTDQSLTMV